MMPSPPTLVKPGKSSTAKRNARKRRANRQKGEIKLAKQMANMVVKAETKPKNAKVRNLIRPSQVLSPAGKRWLERVCNPCATDVVPYGVPDNLSTNVVTPTERSFFDLDINSGNVHADSGAADPEVPWSFCLISDGTHGLVWYQVWQGSSANPSYLALGRFEPKLFAHVNSPGFTSSRLMYMGVTAEMTGPTIMDQGEMTIAQLQLNRRTYYLKPAVPNADDPAIGFAEYRYETYPVGDGFGNKNIGAWIAELPEVDPQCIGHKAKLGAYSPHKLDQPILNMIEHTEAVATDPASTMRYILNPFYALNTFANQATEAAILQNSALCKLRGEYGFNGVVIYAGDLSAQSSFRIKLYEGYEATVAPSSGFRYYTHPSPDTDHAAIEIAHQILTKMPSGFTSDHNAFGWLKKIWNVVKKPIASILPTAGSLVGNLIAPGSGGAVGNKLGGMLGSWLS